MGPAPAAHFRIDDVDKVVLLPGGYGHTVVSVGTHRCSVALRGMERAALDVVASDGGVINLEFQTGDPSSNHPAAHTLERIDDRNFRTSRFSPSGWRRQLVTLIVATPILVSLVGLGVVLGVSQAEAHRVPQILAALVLIAVGAWLLWRLPYTGIRVRYYELHRNIHFG